MILSIGARTDVVTHYYEWLKRRFEEGFVYSRNPLFPNKVTCYELAPEKVDAILFFSKNYAPILSDVRTYCERYRTYFYYAISPYGMDIEPYTYNKEDNIKTLIELSKIVGRERITWRYEPVFLDSVYTKEFHFDRFEYIADRVAAHVGRCVFAFVDTFRTHRSMPDLEMIRYETKREIAKRFGEIAAKHRMPIQVCCESGNFADCGVKTAACTTLEFLGSVNKCKFSDLKHTGNKRGCHCIVSRDVGWYGACPSLCKYCYGNNSVEEVSAARDQHDPASPLLIGKVKESDLILSGSQRSYLKNDGRQISLFDR